ncbi:MAG: HAD family hydrolase [Chloroflexi bacterium]|nr:HAD family hydrolase [Chloroflexota bacterium]
MRPIARAVFLDRDGTLIRDKKYAYRPEEIELLDGVLAGLRTLQQADFRLLVITNQSGVARGLFEEEDVRAMHRYLRELLLHDGVGISGFYYCPHHPDGCVPAYAFRCQCRKPEPGLILRASLEHGISLPDSWLIGDFVTDARAGLAAGCNTILINNGPYAIDDPAVGSLTMVARDFTHAAKIILDHEIGEDDDVQPSRYRAKVHSAAGTGSRRFLAGQLLRGHGRAAKP